MADDVDPRLLYYMDKSTGFRFDPQVGAYAREESMHYEDPRLGYVVRYRGPGSERIDIYLYDMGWTEIPEGVEGRVILEGFSAAVHALTDLEKSDGIDDFEMGETAFVTLNYPAGAGPEFMHAEAMYACNEHERPEFTGPQTSHMFFRGYRGKFLKVRFSHPIDDTVAARARFDVFLTWLAGQFEPRH